jgi:VanZ family protein
MNKPLNVLRLAASLSVAAIIVLSVVPGDQRPHLLQTAKLEHLGAYFIVGAALVVSFAERRRYVPIGLFLTVLAGVLELAQMLIPGRVPKVSDWVVSSMGAWAGIGAIVLAVWTYEHLLWQNRLIHGRHGPR